MFSGADQLVVGGGIAAACKYSLGSVWAASGRRKFFNDGSAFNDPPPSTTHTPVPHPLALEPLSPATPPPHTHTYTHTPVPHPLALEPLSRQPFPAHKRFW